MSFESLRGICQADAAAILNKTGIRAISRTGIPDDQKQSIAFARCPNFYDSAFAETRNSVLYGIFEKRLQQHAWHSRIQTLRRDLEDNLQPLSQSTLFDRKILLGKIQFLRQGDLRNNGTIQQCSQQPRNLRKHACRSRGVSS